MDAVTAKTAFELHLSTSSKRCHDMGGGSFEFSLDYQEMRPDQCLKIGLKNLRVPEIEKTVTFQMIIFGNFEKWDPKKMKTFTVKYRSFPDLAQSLEAISNSKFLLATGQKYCLNFATSHLQHDCDSSGTLGNSNAVKISYNKNRFLMEKHEHLHLFMSQNLAKLLGFNEKLSPDKLKDDYVTFDDKSDVSDYVYFLTESESRLVVVLHDSIADYSVMEDGHSWPILFSGRINGQCVGRPDKLLTVKTMINRRVDRFHFSFLNGEMKPFCPEINMRENPITFTIVFFK